MRKVDEARSRPQTLPRNLDVTLLELFDCVRRTRNLSAAGAQLGMSQPAVSRGLARLREMYGDELFVRRPRGVAPTAFADALAMPVSSALDTLRATFERPTFEHATEARCFRVSMNDIGERLFLPRLMEHMALHAPHVAIETVSPPSFEQLHEGLTSGRIDLAIGFLGGLGKQVRERRLFRERFVYVAREGHPIVNGKLRREQLRLLPHVVGGPVGMRHAAAVEKVLTGPRVKARIALRVHSLLCVGPVAASTDLIGAIPSNLAAMVASHMPLQLVEAPVQFPGFDITMAWHQRSHRDPGNEWLREVLVSLFEGLKVVRGETRDLPGQ